MILTAVAGWKRRQCLLASSARTARSNPPVKKELRCRIFFWIKSLKSNKISWRFTRTESMGRTSKCLEPAHLQLPALLQFIINLISRSSLSDPVAIENLWNKRFVPTLELSQSKLFKNFPSSFVERQIYMGGNGPFGGLCFPRLGSK